MIELFIIFLMALIMETIDSGLGMMYGTILAPILIIAEYDPFLVVPAILISQAIGGFVASYNHDRCNNAEWHYRSKDFKIASFIIVLGLIAVGMGVYIGSIIPSDILKTYIGILCIVMGSLVISRKKFNFSWKKIGGIGILSSFNKALSGGGFGPIVATGSIASGIEEKKAIGITDFAEAPICLTAFLIWIYLNGFPYSEFLLPLCIGAAIGGAIGPLALSKVKSAYKIKFAVAVLALISGIYILYNVWW